MTARRLAIVAGIVLLLVLPDRCIAVEHEEPRRVSTTTTCTTFANGQGGGYICVRP